MESDQISAPIHIKQLTSALHSVDFDLLGTWADHLVSTVFVGGARLLVAGNGGSAAQAQHLTAELVGRFRDERQPMSALALHAETSTVTAVGNDYGFAQVFARQVHAHGRPGDILLLLSTSGSSPNLLAAADAAHVQGLQVWAMTGPGPNPLSTRSSSMLTIHADSAATIQECHLVAIHAWCRMIDERILAMSGEAVTPQPSSSAGRRLVVVGDAFLDRDHVGTRRPHPRDMADLVVDDVTTTERPGGAALAGAMAGRAPGWQVSLVTALGTDDAGIRVRRLLESGGVEVFDLGLSGRTATKSRVLVEDRSVMRLDEAQQIVLADEVSREVAEALRSADAVLVSDYGLGLVDHPALRALLDRRSSGAPPLVWDPHPRGGPPVAATTVAVPNAHEAACAVHGDAPSGNLTLDLAHARALLDRWPVEALAVTRGVGGVALVRDADAPAMVIPADDPAEGDSCGAGDRFAVELALRLGTGASLPEAAEAAVTAAGDYVRSGGPSAFTDGGPPAQAVAADPLALVGDVRARGGRIVATAGCFDVLHRGHVGLLRRARALGDCLVVCLNSDDSVERIKGPARPVVTESDRAVVLGGLDSVDAIIVFTEDTPHAVLNRVRPDVYVKGGDYAFAELPEKELVESWGGIVVLLPYLDGRSTTNLIERAARGEHCESAQTQEA